MVNLISRRKPCSIQWVWRFPKFAPFELANIGSRIFALGPPSGASCKIPVMRLFACFRLRASSLSYPAYGGVIAYYLRGWSPKTLLRADREWYIPGKMSSIHLPPSRRTHRTDTVIHYSTTGSPLKRGSSGYSPQGSILPRVNSESLKHHWSS